MTPEERENYAENMLEKIMKLRVEIKRKHAKIRKYYLFAELIIYLTGYGVLLYVNPWICLGVFIATAGNNLGLIRTIYQDKDSVLKDAWKNN